MVECKYFELETITILSRNSLPIHQRCSTLDKVHWCSHPKHSLVDREIVMGYLGESSLLDCEGDCEKCLLTKDQFNDV